MVVQGSTEQTPVEHALNALTEAGRAAARSPGAALDAYARGALLACRAEAAVVRLPEGDELVARAVHASSPSLAAELEGTRVPAGAESSPTTLRLPLQADGKLLGRLELTRHARPFDDEERALAQVAADALALVLHARGAQPKRDASVQPLVLAGEALAAGAEPEHVATLAAEASGATAALLWFVAGEELERAAEHGSPGAADAALLSSARVALASREFLTQERIGGAFVVGVRLGEPALGLLQLTFPDAPADDALAGIATFSLRAAHALRAGARVREDALELDRVRALLALVGEATSTLSISHTLATAIEQTSSLLDVERVAVYLREDGRLLGAAGRAVVGPHDVVAEALLGLVLGPYRGRSVVEIEDVARSDLPDDVRGAAAEAAISSALAVPLTSASGGAIGLLAVYPPAGRKLSEHERALLGALAAQLGAAVQNARLHEHAKALASELEATLAAERDAARRLRALHEVSQSFAQSLSFEAVLDSLAASTVELLGVDAATVRMPDERRELMLTRALHVADARLDAAAHAMLSRPQTFAALPLQRLLRTRRPIVLTPQRARELGGAHELLIPFLEKGSTAAVLPVATPAEVIATLTIVSFDPGRPIGDETVQTALSLAAQAALAIDNGRLYQQQKEFADTMQRSLLPRTRPTLPGLAIGEVYESSARVDVGGDVYDYLVLGDGSLAVVLGDVTGHGIEATADMAMAKFVFRSLAREHPRPGDFLAAANDVVVGEIAPGKFITMAYVTVDPRDGTVVAASAGHPAPLVVSAEGSVEQLEVGGLALGVEASQLYDEQRTTIAPGELVVVFTDGVVEARRDGELYGQARLSDVLARAHRQAPAEIARAVLDDCRAYAGGELPDDCAVVVIKRTE